MIDSKGYAHALKKDLWSEIDVNGLFGSFKDGGVLISLLRSSIAAGKIIPVATQQIKEGSAAQTYCFKPMDICEWAIAKQITFPDTLQDWYNKQCSQKLEKTPAYLDATHPLHSRELSIAISAWEAVLQANPDKPKTGSRKQLIEKWLREHHPKLKQAEIDRITTMINPDKDGGAPKTE